MNQNTKTLILPKENRKEQRGYDKYLHQLRHRAKNCFLSLKRWRDCNSLCQDCGGFYRRGTMYRYLGCYLCLTLVDTI